MGGNMETFDVDQNIVISSIRLAESFEHREWKEIKKMKVVGINK